MECGERSLLKVDGLRFGNGEMLLSLLPRIARRDDELGDLLAEGTRRAAERIGNGAPILLRTSRAGTSRVRAAHVANDGARLCGRFARRRSQSQRRLRGRFSTHTDRLHGTPESAALAVETENRAALIDSLILCKFLRGVFTDLFAEAAELLRSVTGWNVTAEELRTTAQRIVNAKKLYNLREGWTPAEDTLPPRFLREACRPEQKVRHSCRASVCRK